MSDATGHRENTLPDFRTASITEGLLPAPSPK